MSDFNVEAEIILPAVEVIEGASDADEAEELALERLKDFYPEAIEIKIEGVEEKND